MHGTKQVRKFGGRPVEREPEPGKKAAMNLAMPLPIKRRVEASAMERGWSVSNEAAFRFELSFMFDEFDIAKLIDLLAHKKPKGSGGLLGREAIEAAERRMRRAKK
jgi:hypothetical protein